jgi:hypothetical protein
MHEALPGYVRWSARRDDAKKSKRAEFRCHFGKPQSTAAPAHRELLFVFSSGERHALRSRRFRGARRFTLARKANRNRAQRQ